MNKTILIYCLLGCFANLTQAQSPIENWDTQKLIGERYVNKLYFHGSQYLSNSWNKGTVYFTSGDSIPNVLLKYNRYQDELINYNDLNSTMVKLDKKPISGFSINISDRKHSFMRISYDSLSKKGEFCEILYHGKYDLVAYRKSDLLACSTYQDENGAKLAQEFITFNRYSIYMKGKGFIPLNLKRKSLLLKFGMSKKNEIKKILRKNRISITDENSMIKAWALLEKNGYTPIF